MAGRGEISPANVGTHTRVWATWPGGGGGGGAAAAVSGAAAPARGRGRVRQPPLHSPPHRAVAAVGFARPRSTSSTPPPSRFAAGAPSPSCAGFVRAVEDACGVVFPLQF
uniref:Uncharacterized protein n=1 Tax=Oryza sativa subsp. japonica TaxID=39947 RepID=Q5VMG3_ORYSJ|nr:hypothetical protein [Oryza sativa Japonica Group]